LVTAGALPSTPARPVLRELMEVSRLTALGRVSKAPLREGLNPAYADFLAHVSNFSERCAHFGLVGKGVGQDCTPTTLQRSGTAESLNSSSAQNESHPHLSFR